MSTPALVMQPGLPPAVRRVRGYFAPVNRLTATPTAFDPTTAAAFDPDTPPAPWMDLGWIDGFTRASETKLQVVESGAPGTVLLQGRQSVGATVSMTFERWSKLTMALACGAQQTNVLKAGANPVAITAASSTATFLSTPNGAGTIQAGDMIAVDMDYTGQTGYVGAGASAAYLATAITSGDLHWIRRMTLNVGRVTDGDGYRAAACRAIAGRCACARDAGTVHGCTAGSRRRHILPGVVRVVLHAGRTRRRAVLLLPAPADDGGARRDGGYDNGAALAGSAERALCRSSRSRCHGWIAGLLLPHLPATCKCPDIERRSCMSR